MLDLADCARTADQAVSLALRAIGRRRTTARRLAAAIGHRPRVRWRADLLAALDPMAEGTHSLLEYRYGTRVERPHGLPGGARQRLVMRNGKHEYQDVSYDAYRTVVELDGRAAHPEEDRWRDHWRDNVNLAHGVATLRLGWLDVTERPCASAALVGAALRHRGWGGALGPCGPGCALLSPRPISSSGFTPSEG